MIVPSPFYPAWWLPGPHAQTLWPNLVRCAPRLATRRERLELPDGDFLDLDWTAQGDGPLVVVLHGLEGSRESHYAAGLMAAVQRRGWRALLMHFRGCSGEPNRLARSYHSGETGDLDFLVRTLGEREPRGVFAVVGYSLGGNVLLKWLGEQGASAALRAAVAVSVPFELAVAAQRLEQGLSRVYQRHLLRRLRASRRRKYRDRPPPLDWGPVSRLTTFRQFDECVTAPLHGFAGADDYYARSSSRQYLARIAVPTLIVHALDDPFMTPLSVPREEELSPAVTLELSAHGGHVGFVAGRWPWRARYWLESRIPEFLAQRLDGQR